MASEGEKRSGLGTVEKVVGLLIAALGAFSAYQSTTAKAEVERQSTRIEALKAELAARAEDRETRKLNHDITIRIFDEVKDVYVAKDQTSDQRLNRILAVTALIQAIPDPAVREQLAAALSAASENLPAAISAASPAVKDRSREVRSRVDVAVFEAQEQAKQSVRQEALASPRDVQGTPAKPVWAGYDFDLFWCERGPDPEGNRRRAEAAARMRDLDPAASGRWRVRKLPAEVNERGGYRIDGYVIHVTTEEEERIAEVMRQLLRSEAWPAAGAAAPEFAVRRSSYPSPGYVSLFFCPGARGGR